VAGFDVKFRVLSTTNRKVIIMSKPNIFDYATSELSQDAVLAYMLAWAHPDHKKMTKLHKLGQCFLRTLLAKAGQKIGDIEKVTVQTQDNHIDVSVDINEKIFMIIEDKVDTMRHGEQIKRYKEIAEERFDGGRQIVAIYLKTGNESASYHPESELAACFFRADVLGVLGANQNTGSDIVEEFRIHLQRLEDDTNSFKESDLIARDDDGQNKDGWLWRHAHEGYFMYLEEKLNWDEKGWGYTPNKSGGHLEFYSGWKRCSHTDSPQPHLALQVIHNKGLYIRVVKLGDGEKVYAKFLYPLLYKIENCAKSGEFGDLRVRKPSKFGTGASANVAKIYFESDINDYRAVDGRGKIDLAATLDRLNLAMEFLQYICENIKSD